MRIKLRVVVWEATVKIALLHGMQVLSVIGVADQIMFEACLLNIADVTISLLGFAPFYMSKVQSYPFWHSREEAASERLVLDL